MRTSVESAQNLIEINAKKISNNESAIATVVDNVNEYENISFTIIEHMLIQNGQEIQYDVNGWNISDYIEVESNTTYLISVSTKYNDINSLYELYDSDKNIIYALSFKTYKTEHFNDIITIPANAKYIRICSMPTYPLYIKKFIGTKHQISNDIIDPINNLQQIVNKLNLIPDIDNAENVEFTIIKDYVLDANGTKIKMNKENSKYNISENIPVSPGEIYVYSGRMNCTKSLYCIYTADMLFLDGVVSYDGDRYTEWLSLTNYIIKIPENASFIVVASNNPDPVLKKITSYTLAGSKFKKWSGKKWTVVGDSLTNVNFRSNKRYFDYISDDTGIEVLNMGISGTGYMKGKDNNTAFYQRITNINTGSDVVTIFGSGNDLSLTLGEVTDTGTDTICGCVNTTIDNLYSAMPIVHLGIVTPTPWSGNDPSTPGRKMELYSEALVEICRRRSIPCLDLYHCSNLRPSNEEFRTLAYSKDDGNGVHPDEVGHEIIAAQFKSFLEKLII